MKTEKEVNAEIKRAKKELLKFKEELKKDPTNKDYKHDVFYITHYIKHLEWVLK